jgi:MFS family permease
MNGAGLERHGGYHTPVTRWIAAAGACLVSLDSTVNVAFPAMTAAFAIPPERVRWVIIGYVFSYAVTSFVAGALADRVGHGRVLRAGLALSAAAFLLASVAPTFGWLLLARVVQGLGGGCVYGTAPGIVSLLATPATRGRALGFLNAAIGLGFSAGPLIAGVLVGAFGWRSIFLLRLPLALATLAWAWSTRAPSTVAPAARLVAARDVLRAPILRAGGQAFIANAAIFAIWLLAPFYLVTSRGLSVFTAGLLFTLTPLGTTVAAPVAGRLADRVGVRGPVVAGLAVEALGLLLLSRADPATPLVIVALALFAAGFGVGLFQVTNMTEIMAAFAAVQQGAAGGFAFLSRTLGVVAGVAVLAQLFAVRRAVVGLGPAAGEAFLAAGVTVALAAVASLARLR